MKPLNNVFFDLSGKFEEVLRYEELILKSKEEYELLKEEILEDKRLHEALTTVGISHNGVIYRKVKKTGEIKLDSTKTPKQSDVWYLDAEDYNEPLNSYQLESKLGGNNE